MTSFRGAYRGVAVLVAVHADLLLFAATAMAALVTAGYLGTL